MSELKQYSLLVIYYDGPAKLFYNYREYYSLRPIGKGFIQAHKDVKAAYIYDNFNRKLIEQIR